MRLVNDLDVDALPAAVDTPTAAQLYGISADHLWALRRRGQAPIEPLVLGRCLRWPLASILRQLGLSGES